MFKGFEGRDRRRAHVRTADEAAAVLDAAVDGDDGEEEEEAAATPPAGAAKAGAAAAPLDADGFRAAARVARALLTQAAVAGGGPGAHAQADQAADLVTRLAVFVKKPRGRAAAALAAGGASSG